MSVKLIGPPGPGVKSAEGPRVAAPSAAGGAGGGGKSPVSDSKYLRKCTPGLRRDITELGKKGWRVVYGKKGDPMSFCDRSKKRIVIARNLAGNPEGLLATIAHEVGHAMYPYPGWLGAAAGETIGKKFGEMNLNECLKDEVAATRRNHAASQEARSNCGRNVPVLGQNGESYRKILESGMPDSQKEKLIARLFRSERTSGTGNPTYYEHYGKAIASYVNSNVGTIFSSGWKL